MVVLERTPAAAPGPASSPLRKSPRFSREVAPPPPDPILPYLRSIRTAMDELGTGPQYDMAAMDQLKNYLTECIEKYGDDYQYSTDPRLLKIWILYADVTEGFPRVYNLMEEKRMFLEHALLYDSYAHYLIAHGEVIEADKVYRIGISRKAEPLDYLKKMHLTFLKHLENIVEEADAEAQFVALPASCMHGGIQIAWKSSVLHVSSMAAIGLHPYSEPGSAGKPSNQALRSIPKRDAQRKGLNSLMTPVAWGLWKTGST